MIGPDSVRRLGVGYAGLTQSARHSNWTVAGRGGNGGIDRVGEDKPKWCKWEYTLNGLCSFFVCMLIAIHTYSKHNAHTMCEACSEASTTLAPARLNRFLRLVRF